MPSFFVNTPNQKRQEKGKGRTQRGPPINTDDNRKRIYNLHTTKENRKSVKETVRKR